MSVNTEATAQHKAVAPRRAEALYSPETCIGRPNQGSASAHRPPPAVAEWAAPAVVGGL
jgi:hypothetical protein